MRAGEPRPPDLRLRPRPAGLTEAQLLHVERRPAICPGIRGTDLHAELRLEYAYARSDSAFQRQLRRPAGRGPGTFETGSGLQTQLDWAHLGLRPLGDQMVELYAGGLGCSWAPAIRFASDLIRPTAWSG